jgi:hypothetical protein
MVGSLFLVAVLAVAGPEVQVGTLDGNVKAGTLQQLSAEKLTLETSDGQIVLPIDQLLSVVAQKKPPLPPEVDDQLTTWIELVDGSRINGTAILIKDGRVELTTAPEKTVHLPVSAIRSVRFANPNDPATKAWPAQICDDPMTDLLAVRKKDAIDFLEGTIDGITAEHVLFRVEGEAIPVKRAKVDGLVFAHKKSDKPPESVCTVEDGAGWRLKAKSILLDQGALKITTTGGEEVSRPIEYIARIDFSTGKVAYLSSLEPESVQWTPYLEFANPPAALAQYYAPRRDDGREHQPIRLGGKTYNKGLSLYSRTALAYRLPAGMKKFQAIAGIDDSVRDGGNVRLEFSADGKKLFDQPITGKDAPIAINLDIEGAKRLSILVDYGDDSDAGDYLNLAEARTLK